MYIVLAILSAVFAGLTNILSKLGLKNVKSTLATAIRTIIVVLFSLLIVFITGVSGKIFSIEKFSLVFLLLSGLATGLSWLCFFRALEEGPVNQVTVIDKSSIVFTLILAFLVLGESFTYIKLIALILISVGTFLMIEFKKDPNIKNSKEQSKQWMLFAFLGAIFAALTSILAKIGVKNVDSNVGTLVRTIVILIVSWLIVFYKKEHLEIKNIDKRSILFLIVSGMATGASWLCFYGALKLGNASVVVPIDKLSILITIGFSYFVLHEKLSPKMLLGLILIVLGTMMMIL